MDSKVGGRSPNRPYRDDGKTGVECMCVFACVCVCILSACPWEEGLR